MYLSDVVDKCQVTYIEDLNMSPDEYFRSGRDKFYFSEVKKSDHVHRPSHRFR